MDKDATLKIAVFLDGRPGHEKQTRGIVEALRRRRPVVTVEVRISRPGPLKYLYLWLSYLVSRPKVGLGLAIIDGCDLLIGTGTHTHLPMLICKQHYRIPAVTCMTPSSLLQNSFDLIFAPLHDQPDANRKHIIPTIGPPNLNIDEAKHEEKVLILLGGTDEKSHYWQADKIIRDIRALIMQEREKAIIVSSSPRTPNETCHALKEIAEEYENVNFFDFRETPDGWVEEQYRLCRYVWVTADSISMVYEALSSGCHVGIIPVLWKKKQNKFKASEDFLKREGMVIDLHGYLSGEGYQHLSKPLAEADRCAEKILGRLL